MSTDVVGLAIAGYRQSIEQIMDFVDFTRTYGTPEEYLEHLRSWARPWERVVCLVALDEALDERNENV